MGNSPYFLLLNMVFFQSSLNPAFTEIFAWTLEELEGEKSPNVPAGLKQETEENQKLLFDGFFPTQEVMDYSSKRSYAFNAGGKGADLLRIKILSERYGFEIAQASRRCRFIPGESDLCPGRISRCTFCQSAEDCLHSGETEFSLFFPKKPAESKNEASLGQKI